jgi:hypothetical protein
MRPPDPASTTTAMRPVICYPLCLMNVATRNRLIIGAVFVAVGGVIGYQMYFSMTPARHADHDHAIASIDAGGFLRVDVFGGGRRNLVGRPGRVLVLHWFDPVSTDRLEQSRAARFSASVAEDPMIEVLFLAHAPTWEGLEEWAESAGLSMDQVYLDTNGRTGELFGVRRIPETLVYDPVGLLAFQAKGSADWVGPGLKAQIEKAKAGVEEID